MNILKTAAVGFTVLSLLIAPVAFAAEGNTSNNNSSDATSGITSNPAGPQSSIDTPEEVQGVIQKITNWMFTIFIALAAMMIIYAAFIYLTSGGGEEVSKAHKMLLYAAVAIAVATLSRGIVKLTENFVK